MSTAITPTGRDAPRDGSVLVMGTPYVFARHKLRKPFHSEVVLLKQQPVLCHMGCGLFYIPTEEMLESTPALRAGIACPTCNAFPKSWRTGAVEEIEVAVRMAFGNVNGIEFLRSLGELAPNGVASRRLGAPKPQSEALVLPPAAIGGGTWR